MLCVVALVVAGVGLSISVWVWWCLVSRSSDLAASSGQISQPPVPFLVGDAEQAAAEKRMVRESNLRAGRLPRGRPAP